MSAKFIWVAFKKEGIHRFPEAGTNPNLKDVAFLQYPHRHMFHFRIEISVTHNDRDLEFIQFQRWCSGLYDTKVLELDNKSCEMISDELYQFIGSEFPGRDVVIEVSEDGENGVRMYYDWSDWSSTFALRVGNEEQKIVDFRIKGV